MADETENDDKVDSKAVKLLARILHRLDAKGASETEAEDDEESDFAASKKEYSRKAKFIIRRLEKRGAKIVTE